jgi:cytochrome c1
MKQAKVMSSEVDIEDGPNDEGDMFMRPGKLADPSQAIQERGCCLLLQRRSLPP